MEFIVLAALLVIGYLVYQKFILGKEHQAQHSSPRRPTDAWPASVNLPENPLPPGDTGEFVKMARAAWKARDFDRARLMYQKSAYAASVIADKSQKELINAALRDEQARYVMEDPLFHEVLSTAAKVIQAEPGILQSKIYERLPHDRDLVQWALYYGEVIGRVRRDKKGRSYALTMTGAES